MDNTSLADILKLDVPDRLRLVQAIWDSIAEAPESVPLTDEERAVLDRRLEDYYRDPHAGSPWSDVRARILRRA
ncbi:MAG: addiction module protein [Deltaproteobacteria bacterium]|nr:addiction module protein [Deltaproteobacteria bacterium]